VWRDQGGLTPEQQAVNATARSQLGVAQAREKRGRPLAMLDPRRSLDADRQAVAMTGQLPPMGMGKQGAAVRTRSSTKPRNLCRPRSAVPGRGLQSEQDSPGQVQGQRDAMAAFEETPGRTWISSSDSEEGGDTSSPP
jgi:hypothetical protein